MVEPSTAEIALEVDRLVIGVHRAVMSAHRSELRELVHSIGLASPGHLYDLAEFIAAGACTVEIARRRFRYESDDAAVELITTMSELGLVDDRRRPSSPLAAVIDRINWLRADTAKSLWGPEVGPALPGASEALARASGPLVDTFGRLPVPIAGPHRLHHLLTGLRYARLDAHMSAWEEAGLTAADIVALSSAATSEPTGPRPGTGELVGRGWLTVEGQATAEGRAARVGIEDATNARSEPLFAALTDRSAWFAALGALATPS